VGVAPVAVPGPETVPEAAGRAREEVAAMSRTPNRSAPSPATPQRSPVTARPLVDTILMTFPNLNVSIGEA